MHVNDFLSEAQGLAVCLKALPDAAEFGEVEGVSLVRLVNMTTADAWRMAWLAGQIMPERAGETETWARTVGRLLLEVLVPLRGAPTALLRSCFLDWLVALTEDALHDAQDLVIDVGIAVGVFGGVSRHVDA
jgi:hypothetical protein